MLSEQLDKLVQSKILPFENEKNNCWLNASLVLVAHSKFFRKTVDGVLESQINKIISIHDAAISLLNDSDINIEERITETREMMQEIQNSTLQYLQQFLKNTVGEPDSAFCALLNLIMRDKSDIGEHLKANWLWEKQCTNCGSSSKSGYITKPIITLSKVKNFQPECPTSIYMCQCKTEQEMKLIYKELPPCLIFHFENGAGMGNKIPLNFTVKERVYQLTGVVILEKSLSRNANHFVTWARNPSVNMWLDCNDLNTDIISFSSKFPECSLKDICMYLFESFDNFGKIRNEVTADQVTEDLNVEVIDLADEAEEAKRALQNSSCDNNAVKSQSIENKTEAVTSVIENPSKCSNADALKKTLPNGENMSGITTIKNLKTAVDNKSITNDNIDNTEKTPQKSNNVDYSKKRISNLRCVFLDKQNKGLSAARSSYNPHVRHNILKKKFQDGPEKLKMNNTVSLDGSPGANSTTVNENVNARDKKNEGKEEDQTVKSNENIVTNLNTKISHSLPANASSKHNSTPSSIKSSKMNSFDSEMELGFEEKSPRKRKYSHRESPRYVMEDATKELEDKPNNVIPNCSNSEYVTAHKKSKKDNELQENKQTTLIGEYGGKKMYGLFYNSPKKLAKASAEVFNCDEKNFYLKMYKVPLKKIESMGTISSKKNNKQNKVDQTQNLIVDADVPNTSRHESSDRKSESSECKKAKTAQTTRNKNLKVPIQKPIKQNCKESANDKYQTDTTLDEKPIKQNCKESGNDKYQTDKTLDEKVEKFIDEGLNKVLAAFIEQVFGLGNVNKT